MSYLRNAPGSRRTPQTEKIPGSDQVENSAGGFSWKIDPLQQLQRFLILSSEGGSYYATQQDLTKMNVQSLSACDPYKAIDLIVEVSQDGRAPKNDPALFALAYYAGYGEPRPEPRYSVEGGRGATQRGAIETEEHKAWAAKDGEAIKVRKYALDRLPQVARIGTHLFHFLAYVEMHRGWGRSLRTAIAQAYEREGLGSLAYDIIKYRQRDGWTQRDALRLAHPKAPTPLHAALYEWTVRPSRDLTESVKETLPEDMQGMVASAMEFPNIKIVEGFVKAQAATDPKETARLVTEFNLPREALNTDHLTSPDVWEALLYAGQKKTDEGKVVGGMPLTALMRNLPTMTRVGLLAPMSSHVAEVTRRITDAEALKAARVHPLNVLTAHITYQQGASIRGSATWQPIPQVVDALDAGFYAAFGAVEPTGKRILLGLDVSSSMDGGMVNGVPGLTPRIASAAMALVTAAVEPNHYFVAFSDQLVPIEISPRERLDAVVRKMRNMPFGGTDCALPMLWAMGKQIVRQSWYSRQYDYSSTKDTGSVIEVDAFGIYTDNETWFGSIHPAQALTQYRQKTGIPARSFVVAMTANPFTIADPQDPGMLDVVGFDGSAPQIISEFVAGKL